MSGRGTDIKQLTNDNAQLGTDSSLFLTLSRLLVLMPLIGLLPAAGVAEQRADTNSRPHLTCGSPVWDFGKHDNEDTVEHVFVLHNDGPDVVLLGKVIGCCGSTAELSTGTVLPGGEAAVKITLPLKGRSGEQSMSFYVQSNSSAVPLYELRIKGIALAKVDIQPGSIMLGSASEDTVIEKTVSIGCQSNIIFRVTNTVSSAACIGASYLGVSGNVHRVSVRTIPPLPFGIIRATVSVMTDHSKYPVLEVPVLARVTKDVVVFPSEIRLAKNGGGKAETWYGVVRSISRTQFKITGTEVPSAGIEVGCSPLSNGGYKVEVRNLLPQPDLDGKQIILKTDNAGANDVGIPIQLFAPDGN